MEQEKWPWWTWPAMVGYVIVAMGFVHVAITVGDTWLGMVLMFALGVACLCWKAAGPMIGLAPMVGVPCYAVYCAIRDGKWGSLLFVAVMLGGVYGLEVWSGFNKRERQREEDRKAQEISTRVSLALRPGGLVTGLVLEKFVGSTKLSSMDIHATKEQLEAFMKDGTVPPLSPEQEAFLASRTPLEENDREQAEAPQGKPRQNIVYLSAELNRLCWFRVSTDISIRDLSSVGGLIVLLYSVVAHRNATLWVQSI